MIQNRSTTIRNFISEVSIKYNTSSIQQSGTPNSFCPNNYINNFSIICNDNKNNFNKYLQSNKKINDFSFLINQLKMIDKTAQIGKKKTIKHQNKKMFTNEEDQKLIDAVNKLRDQKGFCWTQVSEIVGGNRTPRQCRERYKHYLDPHIKNPKWTTEEDILLMQKYEEYGPKWSIISKFFKARTDVNIKNHWTVLNQRIQKISIGNYKNFTIPYIKALSKLNSIRASLNEKSKIQSSLESSNDNTEIQSHVFNRNENDKDSNSYFDFELINSSDDFNDSFEMNEISFDNYDYI